MGALCRDPLSMLFSCTGAQGCSSVAGQWASSRLPAKIKALPPLRIMTSFLSRLPGTESKLPLDPQGIGSGLAGTASLCSQSLPHPPPP